MEPEVIVTRQELISALEQWDAEAKASKWPDSDDPNRFAQSADYLISLLTKKGK